MVGRVMPCIGADGEFASDTASRTAALAWLATLLTEGKHWSEARGEIAEYYRLSGLDNQSAHAKSKAAKEFIKPWLGPSGARVRNRASADQKRPIQRPSAQG